MQLHENIITHGHLILHQNNSDPFSYLAMAYSTSWCFTGQFTGAYWGKTLDEISNGNWYKECKRQNTCFEIDQGKLRQERRGMSM